VPQRFHIRVAEDNVDERQLLVQALERPVPKPITVNEVSDGVEVVGYLKGEGEFSNREQFPFPDLLILDLKMPRMDGLQVLRWLRVHAAFSTLITVMLSSSGLQHDIVEAYRLGINSYFQKPVKFHDFARLMTLVTEYWMLAEQGTSGWSNRIQNWRPNGV
jgi:two-component system, response regulator